MLYNRVKSLVFFILLGCSACAPDTPEQGRMPWDDDVSCMRKELSGQASFALAVAFCQRKENGALIPLNFKNAPDLQRKADQEGYYYVH